MVVIVPDASFLFESAVKCIMDTSNSDQETEDAFPGRFLSCFNYVQRF